MLSGLVLALGLAASAPPAWFAKSMLPARQIAEQCRTMRAEANTAVVIDANNVRGAVNFRLSKHRLAALVSEWSRRFGFNRRVVICWDHGLDQQVIDLGDVSHVFAGPCTSADDVIAEAVVPGLLSGDGGEQRVYVVTTDRELIQRVKSAADIAGAKHGKLRLLGTRKFVSLLLHAAGLAAAEGDSDRGATLRLTTSLQATEDGSSVEEALRSGCERGDQQVRRFAASLRRRRPHERKRREKADGYGGRFGERSWHRVLLAERFRRQLLVAAQTEVLRPATSESAPPPMPSAAFAHRLRSPRSLVVHRSLRGTGSAGSRAPATGSEAAHPEVALLLADVRLDGKQRALILRYASALAVGAVQADEVDGASAVAAEVDGSSAVAAEVDGLHPPQEGESARDSDIRVPPRLTRRQRRRQRRERADELLARSEPHDGLSARHSLKELRRLEEEQQMAALQLWLDDGDGNKVA